MTDMEKMYMSENKFILHGKFYIIAVLCLSCFLIPFLVQSGWVEEKNGKTVIHVVSSRLPNPSNTDTASRADYACYRRFIENFPKLFADKYSRKYLADPGKYGRYDWSKVELQMHPSAGINLDGVETDLLAIAGGMSPDILYINFRKSDNYIRNNFLYPLDKPEDGYFSEMSKEETDFRVYPKLWPVIKRKGPDGQVHIWAMPIGGALGKVLFYRKTLFDAKNIPYPDENWTWKDLYVAAKKISDPANGIYGLLLGKGKSESWYWCSYLRAAGGEIMEYNEGTDKWKCVFDSREAAVALDFYIRISNETWMDAGGKIRHGYSSKSASDGSDAYGKWDRDEIGMMEGYIDEKLFANINPDIIGMAPLPKGPSGRRGGEINSRMLGLFSEIRDLSVRDAAWEYLKFSNSPEAMAIRTKVMVEGGLGRFINPKYLTMFGYPEIIRMCPKGWSDIFKIALDSGSPEPYGRNSNFAYDMLTVPIVKAEELYLAGKLPGDEKERLDVLHGLLKDQCARANEIMIGEITPRENLKRRICAVAALLAIVVAFALIFRKIFILFTPPSSRKGGGNSKWGLIKYRWAYIILFPAALTILVWQYLPLLRGSVMAFQDYKIVGTSSWIWLDNFASILFDVFWWDSLWNSLRYSFFVIVLTFIPPIVLAILLQEIPKGSLLFRILFYLPAINTGIVTILLWKQFFEPSEKGMLNAVFLHIPAIVYIIAGIALLLLMFVFSHRLYLNTMRFSSFCFAAVGVMMLSVCISLAWPILVHADETLLAALRSLPSRLFLVMGEPKRWLSDPDTSMISCIIPMLWAGMGPGCLIYLAALKGIPDDYYEAADMDGATTVDKILFIVFPMLKALIVINFIGVFIHSWYSSADTVLALTGGGSGTEVAGLHIWYKAFTYLNFGEATAMAWMLGFMLIGFTVYQLQMLSKIEFRAAEIKK